MGTGTQMMEVEVQFGWWPVSGQKVTFVVKGKGLRGKRARRGVGCAHVVAVGVRGGPETAAHLASRVFAETRTPTRGCANSASRPI
jgi:hypothetical protein